MSSSESPRFRGLGSWAGLRLAAGAAIMLSALLIVAVCWLPGSFQAQAGTVYKPWGQGLTVAAELHSKPGQDLQLVDPGVEVDGREKVKFTPRFQELMSEHQHQDKYVDSRPRQQKDKDGKPINTFNFNQGFLKGKQGKIGLRMRGADVCLDNGKRVYLDVVVVVKSWKLPATASNPYLKIVVGRKGYFNLYASGYDNVVLGFQLFQNTALVQTGSKAYTKGSTLKLWTEKESCALTYSLLDIDGKQAVDVRNQSRIAGTRLGVGTYSQSFLTLRGPTQLAQGQTCTAMDERGVASADEDKRSALRLELANVNDFSVTYHQSPGYTGASGNSSQLKFGGDESIGYDPAVATLKLNKKSAGPKISDGNSHYVLAGARYGVYVDEQKALANARSGRLLSLLVDGRGAASCQVPNKGDYYITEMQAPPGYQRDSRIYRLKAGLQNGDGSNDFTYELAVTEEVNTGRLEVSLESLLPQVTDGHPLYGLGSSRYALYDTQAHAQKASTEGRYATLAVAAGTSKWKLEGIPLDSNGQDDGWWLRQIGSATGYQDDTAIRQIRFTATNLESKLTIKRTPLVQRAGLQVGKYDQDFGKRAQNQAQGQGSLAGAVYRLEYFDTLAADLSGMAPQRTWLLGTDAGGRALLGADSVMEGSDPLYRSEDGSPCLPLGRLRIQEVTAPVGYTLDPTSRYERIDPGTYQKRIDISWAERLQRGDLLIRFEHQDYSAEDGQPQGGPLPHPDIRFACYASRDLVDGAVRAGAAAAFVLTTDGQGVASSEDAALYVVQETDGSYESRTLSTAERQAGRRGIPYDVYLVVPQDGGRFGHAPLPPFLVSVGEGPEQDKVAYRHLRTESYVSSHDDTLAPPVVIPLPAVPEPLPAPDPAPQPELPVAEPKPPAPPAEVPPLPGEQPAPLPSLPEDISEPEPPLPLPQPEHMPEESGQPVLEPQPILSQEIQAVHPLPSPTPQTGQPRASAEASPRPDMMEDGFVPPVADFQVPLTPQPAALPLEGEVVQDGQLAWWWWLVPIALAGLGCLLWLLVLRRRRVFLCSDDTGEHTRIHYRGRLRSGKGGYGLKLPKRLGLDPGISYYLALPQRLARRQREYLLRLWYAR